MLQFIFVAFTIFAQSSNALEWGQLGGDSSRSYSLDVSGAPLSPHTFTYTAQCGMSVSNLILTSSGRLIGASSCPTSPSLIFSISQTSNWTTTYSRLNTPFYKWISQWIMSDDASGLVLAQDPFYDLPFFIDSSNGNIIAINGSVDRLVADTPLIQCPGVPGTFLLLRATEMDAVDTKSTQIYSTNAKFKTLSTTHYMAADMKGRRVAALLGGINSQRQYFTRVQVWNVQTGIGVYKLVEDWDFDFPAYPPRSHSTPAFSDDGRLFVLSTSGSQSQLILSEFEGAGSNSPPKLTQYSITMPFMTGQPSLSITADGGFALVKYAKNPPLVVFSTRYGTTHRRNATHTVIDDQNWVVYALDGCRLSGFCLSRPETNFWDIYVCDPSLSITPTTMIMGKYPGGERRLFIGFDNQKNQGTIVQILQPAVPPRCPP